MAIVYGLTDQGFVNKSLPVIRDDINVALRNTFGASIDLSDRSVLGILVGIFAERLSLLWELLETITASQDPGKATGTLLDALAALTGTLRPSAARSLVTLVLTGNDTTGIAAGSRAATLSTGQQFETLTSVTLALAPAWTPSTLYLLATVVSNAGNIYGNTQGGTSAGSGGPTGTAPADDGSCKWVFLGTGLAYAMAEAASSKDGPIVGSAGDISVIATPIGGWVSVTNPQSALLGRLEGTDQELRVLREFELSNAGSAPLDALRANLLLISGVTSVSLFSNNTDVTDSDGVPPHSVESLVLGGDDQEIFDALLASVAAGIGTYGTLTGSSFDSTGIAQMERFSRAEDVPIHAVLSVTKDVLSYPADGDQQVELAVVKYGAVQHTGRDAVAAAIAAQAFSVVGVVDVPQVLLYSDVITTAVPWAISTPYFATVGARSVVTAGGRSYICVASGTSAPSGTGPSGSGTDITDNAAHWYYLGNKVVIGTRQLATYVFDNISVVSTAGLA